MTFQSKRLIQICFFLLPCLGFMYVSLHLTLHFWYPQGLAAELLRAHYLLFSFVFVGWLFSLIAFHLVDAWHHAHVRGFVSSFVAAMFVNGVFAVLVFYVQPDLILTPRRFLFIQMALASAFLLPFLLLMRQIFRRVAVSQVYFLELLEQYHVFSQALEDDRNKSFSLQDSLNSENFLHQKFGSSLTHVWFVVPSQADLSNDVLDKLAFLQQQGAKIIPYAFFYEQYYRRVPLEVLDDWWFISEVASKRVYECVKRFVDIIVGFLLCVLFLFSFPIVFLAIKLLDSGPVFFFQERYALDGRKFQIIKYRTMRAGTATNTWTAEHDSRITWIGKFLRETRLDELPQCLNVLRGDMSFVGPRPEQSHIADQMDEVIPFYDRRLQVRPGLTGWAQLYVYASTEEDTRLKLQYDLYYLKHRSLVFDLEIMLKTVIHVLQVRGR